MKKLKIIMVLLAGLVLLNYACKKEELSNQEFVQKQFLGKWPLKYTIRTTYTNNFIIKVDTPVRHSPIDTLIFTADGKMVKRNGNTIILSTDYTIDGNGEQITFATTPNLTQKLSYVRNTSIGLITSETTANVGGNEVKTVTVDQLIK